MIKLLRSFPVVALVLFTSSFTAGPGSASSARVQVDCSHGSAFLNISVFSDHRIGRISFEILDRSGRTLYREEGKALTGELVRRLDKGAFPRGAHTLQVKAKDFAVSQVFTVE